MTATTLRAARFEDCMEGSFLLRRLGLDMPGDQSLIEAHWRRLWLDNPALASGRPPLSLGWVLEHGGKMVGFFANFAALYNLGNRTVIAAIASQWGVEKSFRSETPRLAEAYFAQPHADLILVTTAIKPTGRLFVAHGGDPIPQSGLDNVLFWIFDSGGFLEATARKKKFPYPSLARLASPALQAICALRGSHRSGTEVTVSGFEALDARFDGLWIAKRDEHPIRLYACRDARSLRWHFTPHATRGGLRVFTVMTGRDLAGYAISAPDHAPEIGLRRFKLLDLLVRDDDPTMIRALLLQAITAARMDGAHILEAGCIPTRHAAVFDDLRPFSRKLPTWPCFWKALDSPLTATLHQADAWNITPYDGDAALL